MSERWGPEWEPVPATSGTGGNAAIGATEEKPGGGRKAKTKSCVAGLCEALEAV